ncbi:PQQ-dependent sugar dehydrogenase, partial [bacterium]|nr:PQQ-dependent sugar dehydrogenase [bacterium]
MIKNAASGAKFELPVGMAFAPDQRIFVTEKKGKVFVIHKGDKVSEPFIDLESEVLSQHDQGLLGIAVDPNFETNRWVYLLYVVDPTRGRDNDEHAFSRLTRYRARSDDLNKVDLSSRQVLLGRGWRDGFIACSDQHVIGTLRFAQDGTLLVSAGEAGVPGIPDAGGHHPECFGDGRYDTAEDVGSFRSQYIGSLAGKILRIDPNTGLGLSSNPYFTGDAADNQSRIWAYGLRNPFRFGIRPNGSTDPALGRPGSVYIGDVGWNQYEDLNVSKTGGENFGWPCFEGPEPVQQYRRQNPQHSGCETLGSDENPATHTLPLLYWHHTDPNKSKPDDFVGSSVTGGAFYTGNTYPVEYRGGYFFADFVEGWMKVLKVDEGDNLIEIRDFASLPGGYFEHGIVDIQSHPESGDIFYVDITAGEIVQVIYIGETENLPPIAIATADTLWGHTPLTVRFSGNDSYDPEGETLSYLWDFSTGDLSTETDPTYTFQSSGDYTVRLTVTDPEGESADYVLKVIAGSLAPIVTITSPEEGFSLFTDERVVLEGSAIDADEPETNLEYTWIVDLHHNTHVHPSSILLEGKMATFVPGNHGDPWDIIYLEAKLKVTDSSGLSATAKRYVVLKVRGEKDITESGTPIALVTRPTGDGSKDIEVIRDGIFPLPGSNNPQSQYDTFTSGEGRDEDWIGFEFKKEHRFSKVIFQEGMHFHDGGWFDVLNVQIRQLGTWKDSFFLNSVPPYRKNNGVGFETQTLVFTPEKGDAIRIYGLPGGSSRYISVGELRVIETPFESPPPAKFAFIPTDDAHVRSSKPDLNYGTSTELRIRQASSIQKAYLKFNISGLIGTITSAKLRLFVNDGGEDGGRLHLISNNFSDTAMPWDEVVLNYRNAPPIDGQLLGDAGIVIQGQWVEFDVGDVVLGNGIYSFGLQTPSRDMVEYSSKEGIHPPELVIEREITHTPAPTVTAFAPESGRPGSEVTIIGAHFIGYTDVLFSGVSASGVSLDSDSQLRASVPEEALTGRISIVSPSGTAISASDFVVIGSDTTTTNPAPEVTSFVPKSGRVGTLVTAIGRYFSG